MVPWMMYVKAFGDPIDQFYDKMGWSQTEEELSKEEMTNNKDEYEMVQTN